MKSLYAILLLLPSIAFSSSPQEIYKRIVQANGFWTAPKLVVINSNEVQAENRGPVIILYSGLVRAMGNDHELAAVLGHELAHGKLGHMGSSHRNEYAADRLGMQYISRAGYNRCVGAKVLLKMNKVASDTHPASKDRYAKVRC